MVLTMTVTTKCTLVMSLMTLLVGVATPAPLNDYYVEMVAGGEEGYGFPRYGPVVMLQGSRGFWDFLGNWIQDSNWFPIEVNIPDTLGSITTGISNFTSGIIQRIPFLNNNNNNNNAQNGPKPFMLLLPMFRTRFTTKAPNHQPTEAHQEVEMYTQSQNSEGAVQNTESSNLKSPGEEVKSSAHVEKNVTEEDVPEILDNEEDKIIVPLNDLNVSEGSQKRSQVDYRNFDQSVDERIKIDEGNQKMFDEDGFWAYF